MAFVFMGRKDSTILFSWSGALRQTLPNSDVLLFRDAIKEGLPTLPGVTELQPTIRRLLRLASSSNTQE